MRRMLIPLCVLIAVLAWASIGTAAVQTLHGVTGPGYTISVRHGGMPVKTLKAGTYRVAVSDRSSMHNFHLFGPGVNKKTSVPFTGSQTWTVTLRPGKYTYRCDIHAAVGMKGSFRVTR